MPVKAASARDARQLSRGITGFLLCISIDSEPAYGVPANMAARQPGSSDYPERKLHEDLFSGLRDIAVSSDLRGGDERPDGHRLDYRHSGGCGRRAGCRCGCPAYEPGHETGPRLPHGGEWDVHFSG